MGKNENEIMVRVNQKLVEAFRGKHPELKGLTYTAIVEVMLRKAVEER